jgi:Putative peptidoglycan binding domain/D-alanyl-D-alanine carboxypeptidase
MEAIKLKSFGPEVKQWQLFLQSAGYQIPVADGAFGPQTERETIKFQVSHGLKADGVVGEKTWKFITKVSENTPLSQRWPKQDYNSMVNFYGPVGENQTSLELPYPMRLAWDTNVIVKKITCHQKVASSLHTILENTLKTYGQKDLEKLRLDMFGGCINIRRMRGGNSWSQHAWGCAVDIDPDNNQLKWGRDRASFAKPVYDKFWNIVENEGWNSLGRSRGYDYMHFSAVSV